MESKQLPDEFIEFIQLLNSEKVKYLIIGGWAVNLYGNPRVTADIDFFVSMESENVDKIMDVYKKFGLKNIPREPFSKKGNVIRLGFPPTRIELLTGISGVEFSKCYKNRKEVMIEGIKAKFISRKDLITNKIASGRYKDLADVEALQLPKKRIIQKKKESSKKSS